MTGAKAADPVAIIPRPFKLSYPDEGPGKGLGAVLSDGLVIAHDSAFDSEAGWFRDVLEEGTTWTVSTAVGTGGEGSVVELRRCAFSEFADELALALPEAARPQAYRLSSASGKVVIRAAGAPGAFYGLQTLRQLLPDAAFARAGRSDPIVVPEVEILDAPGFVGAACTSISRATSCQSSSCSS